MKGRLHADALLLDAEVYAGENLPLMLPATPRSAYHQRSMTDATQLQSEGAGVCIHRIDAVDYIRYVNPAWLQFASENHAEHLIHRVLGTSLWRHIGGLQVRGMYRVLLERLRIEQRPIYFPFRCDSPTLRRYMEMLLTALPNGGVEFRCSLVREESRRTVQVLDPATSRSDERIVLCAWCKRVHGHGVWMDLDEAIRISSLFDSPHSPQVDHDICPPCREMVR
jgi:hypothetical protein